jgi:hypothetical protein
LEDQKARHCLIVVLHKNAKQIQHHYYRYLVVTPGAGVDVDIHDPSQQQQLLPEANTTSEFSAASSPVMMWENPFATVENTVSTLSMFNVGNTDESFDYVCSK